VPSVQPRAFTLTQAARLAAHLAADDVRPPAGLSDEERLAWWVEELDALRGDVPRGAPTDDDLADPHEGRARHAELLPRLAEATAAVAALLSPSSWLSVSGSSSSSLPTSGQPAALSR
jgi:hypothetical protein